MPGIIGNRASLVSSHESYCPYRAHYGLTTIACCLVTFFDSFFFDVVFVRFVGTFFLKKGDVG